MALLRQVQRRYFGKSPKTRPFMSGIEMTDRLRCLDVKNDAAELLYLQTVLRLAMASGGWRTYAYEDSCFDVGWTWSQYKFVEYFFIYIFE